MENNVNKNILQILQNIIDNQEKFQNENELKIDESLRNYLNNAFYIIANSNDTSFEGVKERQEIHLKQLKELHHQIKETEKSIEEKEFKQITNTQNEYFLLGKNSKTSLRFIGFITIITMSLLFGFKFLPKHFTAYKELKREKEIYYTVYDYLYLEGLKKNAKFSDYIENLKNEIENKDENFFKTYHSLKAENEKAIRRKQLQKELKALE